MTKYLIIIYYSIIIILLNSCKNRSDVEILLGRAEMLLVENPKLALEVLDSVSAESLTLERHRAEYALKYSIALDENHIDLQDDSVISPAVLYYKNYGTPDERLKTLYYLGRIYGNAHNIENEMKCYVNAETYVQRAECLTAVGMLYSAKGAIYNKIYDFQDAMTNYTKAAEYYLKDGNIAEYVNSQQSLASININIGNKDNVLQALNKMSKYWKHLNINQKSKYYANLLSVSSCDNLAKIIDKYLTDVNDPYYVKWLIVADSYNKLNQVRNALNSLGMYRKFTPEYEYDTDYNVLYANLMTKLGMFKDAYEYLHRYTILTRSESVTMHKGDLKFIEQNELAKKKEGKNRLWIIILILGFIVVLSFFVLIFLKFKYILIEKSAEMEILQQENIELQKDRIHFIELYNTAKEEAKCLQNIIDTIKVDEHIKKAIIERLDMINKFVAESISYGSNRASSKELGKLLENKSAFLESTRLSFILAHPRFIRYLKDLGLSDKEIGYCCLYCIGLNGNEIAKFLHRKSFYNVSSVIRKKIGLEAYKTNLDIYLRGKMSQLD